MTPDVFAMIFLFHQQLLGLLEGEYNLMMCEEAGSGAKILGLMLEDLLRCCGAVHNQYGHTSDIYPENIAVLFRPFTALFWCIDL